jgi:hypothetical protein
LRLENSNNENAKNETCWAFRNILGCKRKRIPLNPEKFFDGHQDTPSAQNAKQRKIGYSNRYGNSG